MTCSCKVVLNSPSVIIIKSSKTSVTSFFKKNNKKKKVRHQSRYWSILSGECHGHPDFISRRYICNRWAVTHLQITSYKCSCTRRRNYKRASSPNRSSPDITRELQPTDLQIFTMGNFVACCKGFWCRTKNPDVRISLPAVCFVWQIAMIILFGLFVRYNEESDAHWAEHRQKKNITSDIENDFYYRYPSEFSSSAGLDTDRAIDAIKTNCFI